MSSGEGYKRVLTSEELSKIRKLMWSRRKKLYMVVPEVHEEAIRDTAKKLRLTPAWLLYGLRYYAFVEKDFEAIKKIVELYEELSNNNSRGAGAGI